VVRIVIADDHPIMRRALAQAVISSLDTEPEIVEAGTLAETDAALATGRTDLLLLDLAMPGMAGFAGLALLRASFPSVPVLVVSATEEPAVVRQAIAFGACGYLPKSMPLSRMCAALHAVVAGEVWVPEWLGDAPENNDESQLATRIAELTPQQLRVLMLIAGGKLNKQIAHELAISEATVKFHISQIFRRLAVHSRTQAMIAMQRLKVDGAFEGGPVHFRSE
jgi:DNA-binding NarL/FixJ family response regulator